ncbi:MAG TPA: GNAT family N-acetyltransferase [Pseudolysinimonas sp.]
MSIRLATPTDVAGLEALATEAYSSYLPRFANGLRPAPMDADYASAVRQQQAWVAEEDGSLVGMLILVAESDHLLLENVAVAPDHQGRGIGRELLSFAETQARTSGFTTIRLYTNALMYENQRLYERLGYVQTERRREAGHDRIYYAKDLVAPLPDPQTEAEL